MISPWWEFLEVKICKSKKTAIAKHSRVVEIDYYSLHVYTNESEIDEKIDAPVYVSQIEAI